MSCLYFAYLVGPQGMPLGRNPIGLWQELSFRKLSPCTATSNRMAGIERLTSFGVLDIPV